MKELLLALVADLEDLRANLVVVARAETRQGQMSVYDARDAKSQAIQEHKRLYDGLCDRIEKVFSLELSNE